MLLYDEKSFTPRRFYSFAAYNAKEKKKQWKSSSINVLMKMFYVSSQQVTKFYVSSQQVNSYKNKIPYNSKLLESSPFSKLSNVEILKITANF